MSKVTFYLIILACFVTMIGVITALIRDIKKLKDENKQLNCKLYTARNNVEQLTNYIKSADRVRKEEKKIAEEIKDAKTDEEVHNIISNIISLNNSRVQND
jgi:predicted Holliday junction resolvase-like endonuclease